MEGIGYYDGRGEDERNMLLDSIESGEKLYVHDLAGGLLADLTRIVDGGEGLDGLLDALGAHGLIVPLVNSLARVGADGLALSLNYDDCACSCELALAIGLGPRLLVKS